MKNNTTSNDTCYTIQPLTTCIDIKTERKLIASWHSSGLTDTQIRKMLMLYFGEPAWMNQQKLYDSYRFSEIATGLKFRSKEDFLDILLKCTGFGRIWKNEKDGHKAKNLKAFYTPIWHLAKEEDLENLPDMQEKMHPGDAYNNNIYNINKKKINKRKISSKYAKLLQDAQNSAEREKVIEDCARNLLYYVAQNDDPYNAIVKPINEKTMQEIPGLYLDKEATHPMTLATTLFFNNYIWPYLIIHSEKMMSIDGEKGQAVWLYRIINIDFMQKNIMRAVNDATKYLKLHAAEMMRQYRPISNFEYQDKASKQRFYDTTRSDGTQEQHRIPQDAAPRPSGNAAWNKFSHTWVIPK